MMRLGCTAAVLGLLVLGCSDDNAEPSDTAYDQLVEGLGGKADLEALKGLKIVGSGVRNIPNEGLRPTDPPIQANTFERTVSIDLSADSLRLETERNVQFLFPAASTYTEVLREKLGASTEPFLGAPLGALGSDKAAAIRRQETLLTPQLLLKGLTKADFTSQPDVQLDGAAHHRLVLEEAGPAPLTLFINASTGKLTKLETMELDFYKRDVKLEVFFSDYAVAGNLEFPRKLRLARAGDTLFSEDVSSVEVNPSFEATTFDFPGGVTPAFNQELYDRGLLSHQWYYLLDSVGLPFNGIDTAITPKELAPGVLQLVGGSHHSFLIEQASGVVLVDAPFHEDRGKALSQFIATTVPGKALTHVVASHFHEDHVSGIREVLGNSPGAQLVVHESTEEAWQSILTAPSTLREDALAKAPRAVTILTVPDAAQLTLPDASHPVTLYPLETEHAADLLIAREESSNTVFVVDIYSPGNAGQLNADDFAAGLGAHAVPTDNLKIIGGHGGEVHDYVQLQAQLP
jgi:glyoxylase-like metal-dependent hydrolase (beta-lactamase superfamily II)